MEIICQYRVKITSNVDCAFQQMALVRTFIVRPFPIPHVLSIIIFLLKNCPPVIIYLLLPNYLQGSFREQNTQEGGIWGRKITFCFIDVPHGPIILGHIEKCFLPRCLQMCEDWNLPNAQSSCWLIILGVATLTLSKHAESLEWIVGNSCYQIFQNYKIPLPIKFGCILCSFFNNVWHNLEVNTHCKPAKSKCYKRATGFNGSYPNISRSTVSPFHITKSPSVCQIELLFK